MFVRGRGGRKSPGLGYVYTAELLLSKLQFTNHHHLAGIRVSPYFLESSPSAPPCLPPTCIFLPSFPHGLFQTCYPNFFSTDCPVFPHFLSPCSSECLSPGSQVPPWPPLANLSLCLLPTQRLHSPAFLLWLWFTDHGCTDEICAMQ